MSAYTSTCTCEHTHGICLWHRERGGEGLGIFRTSTCSRERFALRFDSLPPSSSVRPPASLPRIGRPPSRALSASSGGRVVGGCVAAPAEVHDHAREAEADGLGSGARWPDMARHGATRRSVTKRCTAYGIQFTVYVGVTKSRTHFAAMFGRTAEEMLIVYQTGGGVNQFPILRNGRSKSTPGN